MVLYCPGVNRGYFEEFKQNARVAGARVAIETLDRSSERIEHGDEFLEVDASQHEVVGASHLQISTTTRHGTSAAPRLT
jgi:hypothetical protein